MLNLRKGSAELELGGFFATLLGNGSLTSYSLPLI